MKLKLKITLTIISAVAIVAVLPLFNAFNLRESKINNVFTESSTYEIEKIEQPAVIQQNVSISGSNLDTEVIISRIENNLDREINNIHEEYKAEVLGSTDTVQPASSDIAVADSPANLNDIESAILYLINNIRVANGLNALQANQILTDVARSRCNDMLASSYFSHYTPDGRNIFNILQQNGVSYINGGENLGQSSPASLGTPQAFIDAWMASPTHKANILRPVYNKIGIGIGESGGKRIVATVFTN
ncbi:MAG: CAP domain-containing protein [Actinomycetota bacterium]|nr:CAP domain-containing protein [Actinomycetota bacterium]